MNSPFLDYFIFLLCIYRYVLGPDIGLAVRVFASGPGDLGSIPGRVMPKTQKWYLMPPCLTLSNIRYGSRVKWSNPGKGVPPFPTPWCSSYRKRSLRVTLDYGRQLYLLIYIYIYIFIYFFFLKGIWINKRIFFIWNVFIFKMLWSFCF